ncbi:MAG: photosynthetic complex putative assembly protein PuhB [Xanthomonadales bacterium]|nr:photosynthetic complex putative assembly protein PuhB [Xanthomonadales bacterium]
MTHEHEFEPVRGLPEVLPEGERMLWQGEPNSGTLARTAFFRRSLGIYFAVIAAGQFGLGVADGESLGVAAAGPVMTLLIGLLVMGISTFFGWLYAGTTVYTITNRRVVLRFGVAVTLTVNLPLRVIEQAQLRVESDGSGDVVLILDPEERVGYVHMWPLVQRWYFAQPRPLIRGIADVQSVARVLAEALAADAGQATVQAEQPESGDLAGPAEVAHA